MSGRGRDERSAFVQAFEILGGLVALSVITGDVDLSGEKFGVGGGELQTNLGADIPQYHFKEFCGNVGGNLMSKGDTRAVFPRAVQHIPKRSFALLGEQLKFVNIEVVGNAVGFGFGVPLQEGLQEVGEDELPDERLLVPVYTGEVKEKHAPARVQCLLEGERGFGNGEA